MATEIITRIALARYLVKDSIEPNSVEDSIRKAVNAFLENQCGRVFEADASDRSEKITVDNVYTDVFFLQKPPVISFTSLLSGRTSQTTVSADSYEVDTERATITKVSGYFTKGVNAYTAKYKGGYASNSIPDDLQLLAKSIMARAIMKVDKHRHGISSVSTAQGATQYFFDDLEKFEVMLLESYSLNRF